MPNTYEAVKSNLHADPKHSRKGDKKTNFVTYKTHVKYLLPEHNNRIHKFTTDHASCIRM